MTKAVISVSLDIDILEKLKKAAGTKMMSRSRLAQNVLKSYFEEPAPEPKEEKKDINEKSEDWLKWD